MDNLIKIEPKIMALIEESISASPPRLSEILVELSAWQARYSEQLDNILVFKADRMNDLKDELETYNEVKIVWNASIDGKNETILRGVLGRIKNQLSVIKKRLDIKRDESFGKY